MQQTPHSDISGNAVNDIWPTAFVTVAWGIALLFIHKSNFTIVGQRPCFTVA